MSKDKLTDDSYRLDVFRKAAGITQLELANILGISQANVARLEKNPETISVQQLEMWLKACKLKQMVRGSFIEKLLEIPELPVVQFARGVEDALRSMNTIVDLRQKPLLAVFPDSTSSVNDLHTFVRSLLFAGDKLFFGHYLPPNESTVIWKHLSDRPSDMDQSVYILEGVLEPWMRGVPTKHLRIARDSDDSLRAGSFSIMYGQNMAGKVMTVFSDHPLLRHTDVLQVAPFSSNIQSFHNFRMIVNAEISVLCVGNSVRLTAPVLLSSLGLGRAFDFIVCREGMVPDDIQGALADLYGRKPRVFKLPHLNSLDRSSVGAFDDFVPKVADYATRAQAEILRIVNNASYKPPKREFKSNLRVGKRSIREKVILGLLGNVEADSALTIQRLSSIFSVLLVVMNPRFDFRVEIDEDEYKSILKKALTNLDKSLFEEIACSVPEIRREIPRSVRELIEMMWKQMNSTTSNI